MGWTGLDWIRLPCVALRWNATDQEKANDNCFSLFLFLLPVLDGNEPARRNEGGIDASTHRSGPHRHRVERACHIGVRSVPNPILGVSSFCVDARRDGVFRSK
mmetsp:Transcript_16809/g.34832  ORF Transcript_16809/g.34832 Transcript_16809/m.34832 type:complete len:103 (-) Transcript_16809:72-380(-)